MIYTYFHIETGATLNYNVPIVKVLPALALLMDRKLHVFEFILIEKKRDRFGDYLFLRSTSIYHDTLIGELF